ncbi:MAG: 4Fe-4S binding protein [Cyanobacteriota bacterium]|nr:4Fe-4S binding protein [Cyanobacteriota bacterium]
MNLFNTWPERQARLGRWALLLGWLALAALPLLPINRDGRRPEICNSTPICGDGLGTDLFWNLGLPLVLIGVVLSHELWRRICPLAFVSQLARALGWQRTVPSRSGKPQLVAVDDNSWLGRHHVQLQWSLLIAGLCLRILIVNSHALAFGLLTIAALLGAMVSGWAYAGKAWCHYLCPFGTAQQVLTGPRGVIGSTAHLDSPTRTTQSMCRTVASQSGQADVSTCVACSKPCLDIDAERAYWQNLQGKRGLNWAWYSYPGLIVGFFLLIQATAPPGLAVDYLKSRLFVYDNRLASLAWEPFLPAGWPQWPRLVMIPLLLTAATVLSQQLFQALERWLARRHARAGCSDSRERAIHQTRLLATFSAVNAYFHFKGNPFGSGGPRGDALFIAVVMGLSAVWLHRGWHRDRGVYERESTSTSLRRQLGKLGAQLQGLLAGRRLEDLSPGEVFVLAKALPVQAQSERRSLYRSVLGDLLHQGRLDRHSSLLKLEELRTSLGLSPDDHQAALEVLSVEDPLLDQLSSLELTGLDLRLQAAHEEIEDLLRLSGHTTLCSASLTESAQQRLERIRRESGLDQASWEKLLEEYAPGASRGNRQLEQLRMAVRNHLAERRSLEQASGQEPLLKPLVLSLDRRIAGLLPPLVDLDQQVLRAGELTRPGPASLALYGALSAEVITFLASEDATTLALGTWLDDGPPEPLSLEPLPEQATVLHALCSEDSDPASQPARSGPALWWPSSPPGARRCGGSWQPPLPAWPCSAAWSRGCCCSCRGSASCSRPPQANRWPWSPTLWPFCSPAAAASRTVRNARQPRAQPHRSPSSG